MQSFVILCRSSWGYRASANTQTGAYDGVFAMLGNKVVFIGDFRTYLIQLNLVQRFYESENLMPL